MKFSLSQMLSGPTDWLIQLAASQCIRRKIPCLTIGRSLPLEQRLVSLRDWLTTLRSREVFNGTVLIAKGGSICFKGHYGCADVEGLVPLSNHSSFSLASVSKQFTAMCIMLLAQKRKLALDDQLAKHIPELVDYSAVTIRQLLHHTSGVPDYMALADEHWDCDTILATKDILALLENHRPPPDSAPGDEFKYSNTGYVLLGEIICRASGMSYERFMAEAIFKPLGMNDSAAFNLTSKEFPLRARVFGFRRRFVCLGKYVLCDLNYLDGVFGDAGVYASAEDLVRWDCALRDGTLIPCEAYQEAYLSGRLNDGETTGYGFGWEIEPSDVVEHFGEWEGFTSYLRRDLKKHTLLVVLSNMGPSVCVDAISAQLARFVSHI